MTKKRKIMLGIIIGLVVLWGVSTVLYSTSHPKKTICVVDQCQDVDAE